MILIFRSTEWHLAIGMAFVLQVGEVEEMKRPEENYSKSHDFIRN
jgi:hypothetical protein